jgi:cytochrome c553
MTAPTMIMPLRTILTLAVLAALGTGIATAADIEAGKKKVIEVCAACHGQDGATPTVAEYPKLAGQYPDYLAKALRDYKSGARKNAIMAGFAQGLTAQDIENISAYFATQPEVLSSRY